MNELTPTGFVYADSAASAEALNALLAEVERLRSQLDDARGKAARLEQELSEARRLALGCFFPQRSNRPSMVVRRATVEALLAALAGPSSVAEFEALGTPVEDKK